MHINQAFPAVRVRWGDRLLLLRKDAYQLELFEDLQAVKPAAKSKTKQEKLIPKADQSNVIPLRPRQGSELRQKISPRSGQTKRAHGTRRIDDKGRVWFWNAPTGRWRIDRGTGQREAGGLRVAPTPLQQLFERADEIGSRYDDGTTSLGARREANRIVDETVLPVVNESMGVADLRSRQDRLKYESDKAARDRELALVAEFTSAEMDLYQRIGSDYFDPGALAVPEDRKEEYARAATRLARELPQFTSLNASLRQKMTENAGALATRLAAADTDLGGLGLEEGSAAAELDNRPQGQSNLSKGAASASKHSMAKRAANLACQHAVMSELSGRRPSDYVAESVPKLVKWLQQDPKRWRLLGPYWPAAKELIEGYAPSSDVAADWGEPPNYLSHYNYRADVLNLMACLMYLDREGDYINLPADAPHLIELPNGQNALYIPETGLVGEH